MTTKTLILWIAYLAGVLLLGQLISPWFALGIIAGSLVGLWLYYRGSEALDETQAMAYWWANRGWQDSPPGEDRPTLSEALNPLLLIIAVLLALAITLMSL